MDDLIQGVTGTGISDAPVLLVCPTRDRPGNAARLIDTWGTTGVCSDLIFCLDDDDPQAGGYAQVMNERRFHRGLVFWLHGPRLSLCGWTDLVAGEMAGRYQALMSIGDDHVPETPAFDQKLWDACGRGGFAYGDDGITHQPSPEWPERHNLPTACLITSNIITGALGGAMCLPGAQHMFTDAYWMMLAEAAGCRYFLPQVKVPHRHHITGLAPRDRTYQDGEASWPRDEAAYRDWLDHRRASDAVAVREAIG